mmetsp:Transcript_7224/g.12199  ORF Transcript_7224/g.12199 Transcript_7224/m.12199 type:complete len:176 (-) Transcript_7224:144-671(-)|eukprot:CAMPEP_0119309700 /NCGR_PEP_ID=MMETSP1333-20130426/16108_1 /TAXON_ID=418940 /ORGANISM="Scyphosphaera apsteinii, Strain RCC1455" /LENGTH=175 /DNA_ID=CAMNT_0007313713 /DNA_START=109 /DNA_END=636 /DNA_ORIENTATION=-
MSDAYSTIPSQADMCAMWEDRIRSDGSLFCKTAQIHAKTAESDTEIVTVINGVEETKVSARVGDIIIQGTEGERYSMGAKMFETRYDFDNPADADNEGLQIEGFRKYKPSGKVWAYQLSAEECATHLPSNRFMARWGQPMTVMPQDFLAVPYPLGGEVYRIEANAFSNTYEIVGS